MKTAVKMGKYEIVESLVTDPGILNGFELMQIPIDENHIKILKLLIKSPNILCTKEELKKIIIKLTEK